MLHHTPFTADAPGRRRMGRTKFVLVSWAVVKPTHPLPLRPCSVSGEVLLFWRWRDCCLIHHQQRPAVSSCLRLETATATVFVCSVCVCVVCISYLTGDNGVITHPPRQEIETKRGHLLGPHLVNPVNHMKSPLG